MQFETDEQAVEYLRQHRGALPRATDDALQRVLNLCDRLKSALAHEQSELRRRRLPLPPDGGLRAPVMRFDETHSANTVVANHFLGSE